MGGGGMVVVVSWCAGVGMAMMVHKCPPPCLLSGVGMVMMVQKAKKEDEEGRKAGEGKNQKLLVPLHTLDHHHPPAARPITGVILSPKR